MAIDLADILNLGLTAYNASQGNAGGAASGLSGILGPIFSSGTAPTTGGQGGGFLSSIFGSDSPVSENPVSEGSGIMDSLGSIFGGSSSGPTGYTGPSVWPQVLGSLASSFRATPRAGASREEREKANRYNMLAGILGAVATGYGKASDEAAKQKATSELYQIFSGAEPTTAAVKTTPEAGASVDIPGVTPEPPTPLSRNERLAEFMRQNPAMAGVAGQLLLKGQEQQQELLKEQYKAAIKAGGRVYDLPTALGMAANLGVDKGSILPVAQGIVEQSKIDKQNAISEALRGITPSSVATAPSTGFADIPKNLSPQEQETARSLTGAGAVSQATPTPTPSTGPTNFYQTLQTDLQKKKIAEEETKKKEEEREVAREEREKERDFRKAKASFGEPYKQVLQKGATASGDYEKIKGDLFQGTFGGTRKAIKRLENMVDGSVVHQYEMKDSVASLLSDLDNLKLRVSRFFDRGADIPDEVKTVLLQMAKRTYDINEQSGMMATSAINEAANDQVYNKNRFATVEQYLPNKEGFTTIAKLRAQLQERRSQPAPSGSPIPARAPVPFNAKTGIF